MLISGYVIVAKYLEVLMPVVEVGEVIPEYTRVGVLPSLIL